MSEISSVLMVFAFSLALFALLFSIIIFMLHGSLLSNYKERLTETQSDIQNIWQRLDTLEAKKGAGDE